MNDRFPSDHPISSHFVPIPVCFSSPTLPWVFFRPSLPCVVFRPSLPCAFFFVRPFPVCVFFVRPFPVCVSFVPSPLPWVVFVQQPGADSHLESCTCLVFFVITPSMFVYHPVCFSPPPVCFFVNFPVFCVLVHQRRSEFGIPSARRVDPLKNGWSGAVPSRTRRRTAPWPTLNAPFMASSEFCGDVPSNTFNCSRLCCPQKLQRLRIFLRPV